MLPILVAFYFFQLVITNANYAHKNICLNAILIIFQLIHFKKLGKMIPDLVAKKVLLFQAFHQTA